jgi:mRNA interferase RelE/StbE
MNYVVKFQKNAAKVIRKLDKTTRNRILDHIKILSENPQSSELDIKRMQGLDNHFRLRIGTLRVVYSLFDQKLIIVIIRVGPRGDVYKGL